MGMYFFAPGPVPTKENVTIDFSHRSNEFAKIIFDLRCMLEFDLDKQVALIQGSASAAIESVIKALRLQHRNVLVIMNGTFSSRVYDLLKYYGKVDVVPDVGHINILTAAKLSNYAAVYVVQFETGSSKLTELEELSRLCKNSGTWLIVDAVSGFPYYRPPKEADVVILSSSKQLRGLPVMGMVAYSQKIKEHLLDSEDYLSLVNAIKYGDKGQTPNTSLMPQILSLWSSLKYKTWKAGVDAIGENAETVADGLTDFLIGETIAPVLTFKTKRPADLAKVLEEGYELQVYFNPSYMTDRIQVSCYNYSQPVPYEELNEALHEAADQGLMG